MNVCVCGGGGVLIPIQKIPSKICANECIFFQKMSQHTYIPGGRGVSKTIYALFCRILSQQTFTHSRTWIFFSNLRTFLSNFVATDVYALLFKSLPRVFFPILVWAKIRVPLLWRHLVAKLQLMQVAPSGGQFCN